MRWEMLAYRRPRPERVNARNLVPTVHEEHDWEDEDEDWAEYQKPECTLREVQSPVRSPQPVVLKPAVILNRIVEENGADELEEVWKKTIAAIPPLFSVFHLVCLFLL